MISRIRKIRPEPEMEEIMQLGICIISSIPITALGPYSLMFVVL